MLDVIRKCAPEKLKELVANTELTDRERCAKLYAYLTQKVDNPKVRIQTEASVSMEGRLYHVVVRVRPEMVPEYQKNEVIRFVFIHTADGEVVQYLRKHDA